MNTFLTVFFGLIFIRDRRDMQRQLTRAQDRPLAQSRAEQQQLQDMIARTVSDYMIRYRKPRYRLKVYGHMIRYRMNPVSNYMIRAPKPRRITDAVRVQSLATPAPRPSFPGSRPPKFRAPSEAGWPVFRGEGPMLCSRFPGL